ncbi:MAG: DPP IV N-terminal domain-containing protein [Rhodospirillaceae bacterium]
MGRVVKALREALNAAAVVAALGVAPVSAAAPERDSAAFFRDLAETYEYTLGEPRTPKFTPDGQRVIFLRGAARDPVLRLYEFNVATKTERELITPAQVLGGAEEQLSAEEKARRERARISTRGFTAFDLTEDGNRLLVVLSGKLYVIDRASLRTRELPGQNWIDPRFSPDGRYVAAVADKELHVIELETHRARPVTSGAGATIHNGVAEFVAQEEMDRRQGFWWAPDSQRLVYQRNDESKVEVRYVADPLHPEAAPTPFFYPRAGTANTDVRLGMTDVDGGATRWIEWDRAAFPYLVRVNWEDKDAPFTIQVQDRLQQNQLLLAVDPASGKTRELLRETDPAWINLDSGMPRWLKDRSQFLWTSERGGAWQVELRANDGKLARVLTPRDFNYDSFVDLDEASGFVYVLGSADPRERHLWRFPIGGGPGEQLTKDRGVHSAVFSKDHRSYVHSYNLFDGRRGSEVVVGGATTPLPSVAEKPRILPGVEITRTRQPRPLDAAIVRPANFKTGQKYPVILDVYAGPTSKRVTVTSRSYFLDQWMADQGYVVVRIDNRGTPGYGRDFLRAIRGNFIDIALTDQVEGLKALAAVYPELDLTRVGVSGWSFGGYFAAMATIRRPDIFRAGVAGAPVVTWENYDTHYTERYLGTPQAMPEAYRVSNVTTYAKDLKRPLLIIHGLTDDNVYVQHSLQLADALFRAGRHYEFMPMLGTHMVNDPAIRQAQQERIMAFFARTLRGSGEP